MGRAPCCDKANVKKGPWSPEEDAKLKAYIEQYGTGGNWIALPQKIGLKRCGKSCRLRWLNYLRPNIRHGGFSEEEDNIICSLYISIGSRWSIIAAQLPGRTDNDIKNYWNTRLKKKLLGKQQKEQQALARRFPTLKQETLKIKDGDKNFNVVVPEVVSMVNHQSPYFALPDSSSGQDLRDLVMKMGVNPVEISQTHDPFFESSNLSQFSSENMQFGVNNFQDPSAAMFHGGEFGDPLQNLDHALEGFYGMENNNMMAGSGSVGSSSVESTSLGEMSSLVYPLVSSSDFEPSLAHNNNVAAFAESRHHYCLQ